MDELLVLKKTQLNALSSHERFSLQPDRLKKKEKKRHKSSAVFVVIGLCWKLPVSEMRIGRSCLMNKSQTSSSFLKELKPSPNMFLSKW